MIEISIINSTVCTIGQIFRKVVISKIVILDTEMPCHREHYFSDTPAKCKFVLTVFNNQARGEHNNLNKSGAIEYRNMKVRRVQLNNFVLFNSKCSQTTLTFTKQRFVNVSAVKYIHGVNKSYNFESIHR